MRCYHALVRGFLGVVIAGFVLVPLSHTVAAVYSPQQALPAQTVKDFLADPSSLLTQFPKGGPDMIKRIRDLAASDPATLNALLGLLAKANSEQAKAIGTALGDVAKMAVSSEPGYATQIQVGMSVSNNDTALAAFNAVVGGDIQLTATTGGAGGGGGGGGGPTNPPGGGGGGGGNGGPNLTTSTTNTANSLTLSSSSSCCASNSVSPP